MANKENTTKTWLVYCHISPNGKKYVGITSQDIRQRWRYGKGYKANKYFTNAIKKYGWNNFEHIIIADNLPEDMAKEMEKMLIATYKSNIRKYGYNITKGGEGTSGVNIWETMDVEVAKEAKRKKSVAMKGRNMIKVICITTGEIFDGITEASEKYKTNHTHISSVCKNKRNYAGELLSGEKLIWRYWSDVQDFWKDEIKRNLYIKNALNNLNDINIHENKYKKVICVTTNEVFDCVKDAIEKCQSSHVGNVCSGTRSYAGTLQDGTKLQWMYYKEYLDTIKEVNI